MAKSSNMILSWAMKGRLDRSLIQSAQAASKQIDNVKKSANDLGKRFSWLSNITKKAATYLSIGALTGSVPGMLLLAKNTAETGDQFAKMSQKAGISAKTLSQWTHAADMSGISTETFGANVIKLNKKIAAAATGNKEAQIAFKRAGVSIRDSAGKLKSADQVMLEMSDTFKKMPAGVYKSDLAMAVFGKSGADMIPLLKEGSQSIKDLKQQAEELGITFSDEEASASEEFCDNLDVLKKSVKGLTGTIGKQLIPIISPWIESMSKWISANRELISSKISEFLQKFKDALPQIRDFLVGVYNGINNTATAMGGWGPILKNSSKLILTIKGIQFAKWITGTAKATIALGKSFKTLIPIFLKFGTTLMANPIGIVIAAIGALIGAGYLLYKNWDKVVNFIKDMWNGVKQFFSDKFASITDAFDKGFINGIMNLLLEFNPVTLIAKAIDGIFKYFTGVSLIDEGKKFIGSFGEGIINMWNSIKDNIISTVTGWIPDWLKDGIASAGQAVGLIDETPSVDVDAHHANGAIVRRRQIAEIGEEGPEAVIPLSKPARGKQLLMESAKIMGMSFTPESSNESLSVNNKSSFFSNASRMLDSYIKPQFNSINNLIKNTGLFISNITRSQISNTDIFSTLLEQLSPRSVKLNNESNETSQQNIQFNSLGDFIKNATDFLFNVKDGQNENKNIFLTALEKISNKPIGSNNHNVIDEMTDGLVQTNNHTQNSSFNPSFNPTITINGVSNSDDIKKQVESVLKEQRIEFEKQFKNYQYQRQRIGVF